MPGMAIKLVNTICHQTLLYTRPSFAVCKEGYFEYAWPNSVTVDPIPLNENVSAIATATEPVGYAMYPKKSHSENKLKHN